MKASEWIDRVKVSKGWESDYRVAKTLGFKGNTISMYRTNGGTMDDTIALKVAQALEIDPAIVLVDQAQERAKDAAARTAWAAVLQRLGGVAAGFLVALGLGTTPPPASAAYLMASGDSVHYVKRRRPPARRAVMAAMARALVASPVSCSP